MSDQIGGDDLVFYSTSGNIYSGGFSIDSQLMRGGVSPMASILAKTNGSFEGASNHVVPPLWFLSSQSGGEKMNYENDDFVIEEDLHDKLMRILEATHDKTSRKNRTRKINSSVPAKRTKRNNK